MRFQLISNFRTVIKHDDGSLQRIQHNPPLPTATILEFLQMLTTEPRDPLDSQPNATDHVAAEETETNTRQSRHTAAVPPQEVVGFFQDATGCHPLRVANPTTILQIITGRAPTHLGRFAVRLYLEAARKAGFGTAVNPIQDEASLRVLFAKIIRELLPELRLRFQQQNPDAANDTPYSLRLLGSFGNPPRVTSSQGGSQAVSSAPAVTSDAGSSAPASCQATEEAAESQSGGSTSSRSHNEVMAQTVRGVLGLGRLALLKQPDRDPTTLDFARLASLASDIRRAVTGNNRGSDVRPRTAMRILGRARRNNLVLLNTIGMSDEELFGQFRHLTDTDAQALKG